MRRATSLIHTSEIQILLNLLSVILILILVNVKTLIMLILFLEQARGRPTWSYGRPGARGHHVGDACNTSYKTNSFNQNVNCVTRIRSQHQVSTAICV